MSRLTGFFDFKKVYRSKCGAALITFLLAGGALFFSPYKVGYVYTPSVPMGFYFISEFEKVPKRDGIYCFIDNLAEWVPESLPMVDGSRICKYALGMPGDLIEKTETHVVLTRSNSSRYSFQGDAVSEYPYILDLSGTEIQSELDVGVIPEGFIYFGSDYEGGWDSRYFGLVHVSEILGKAESIRLF